MNTLTDFPNLAYNKTIGTVTFVLFLFFSCSPVKKYTELSHQTWGSDIQHFQHLDSIETYSKQSILFVGSSSIRLWNTIYEDMKPYSVIQRGFGGCKIEDVAVFLDKLVYPHNCQAVVFFAGTNNITGSEKDFTPKKVLKFVRYISRKVYHKQPKLPIFWIAITPTKSRWSVLDKVMKTNAKIEDYCLKTSNTYFINTASAYLNNNSPKTEYFREDMLHQNHEGYLVWSTIIKSELDKVLKK